MRRHSTRTRERTAAAAMLSLAASATTLVGAKAGASAPAASSRRGGASLSARVATASTKPLRFVARGASSDRGRALTTRVNAKSLEERIAFLESLGVTRDDLRQIVEKTPEILGCDVEQLTTATEYAEKNYFMKRNTRNFVKYLVRVPQALGNNLDCAAEGKSCLGECNRCWARC